MPNPQNFHNQDLSQKAPRATEPLRKEIKKSLANILKLQAEWLKAPKIENKKTVLPLTRGSKVFRTTREYLKPESSSAGRYFIPTSTDVFKSKAPTKKRNKSM